MVVIMRVAPCVVPRQMFHRPAEGGTRGDSTGKGVRSEIRRRRARCTSSGAPRTYGVIGLSCSHFGGRPFRRGAFEDIARLAVRRRQALN
jgi:hypothetical protein